LPAGVLAIVVNDDFGNTSALLIAIESNRSRDKHTDAYADLQNKLLEYKQSTGQ